MDIRSVAQVIRTHGANRPDVVALFNGDDALTYGELDERSNRVANGLLAAGVRPQDHIAWLDKNSPEFFELWFGAAKVDAVLTPVNWRLAPPEVAYIVNDAQATVFVVGQDFLPVLDAIEARPDDGEAHPGGRRRGRSHLVRTWRDGQPATDPGTDGGWDDTVVQMYSSGTTGLPKGVMLSNRNLFTAPARLRRRDDVRGRRREPHRHAAVPHRRRRVGHGRHVPGHARRAGARHRPGQDPRAHRARRAQPRVPRARRAPVHADGARRAPTTDLSSLRYVLYGASPISDEVLATSAQDVRVRLRAGLRADRDHRRGRAAAARGPRSRRPERAPRCAPPASRCRGVELSIVDPATGEDVAAGEVGEIWCRSSR